MIVGFAKAARSWGTERASFSTVGGDVDSYNLLQRLARLRPQHTYLMVGKHNGGLQEFPDNVRTIWDSEDLSAVRLPEGIVTLDVYRRFIEDWRAATDHIKCDAFIVNIGQCGNANSPIPQIGTDWKDEKLASPYVQMVRYVSTVCDFLNQRAIEPIMMTNDARNWWRPRELMRPLTRPILGQYDMTKDGKAEQYEQRGMPWQEGHRFEQSVIVYTIKYEYSGVEYLALDEPSEIECDTNWNRPHSIGIIANENRKEVHDSVSRLWQLKEWVLRDARQEVPLFGSWTEESQKELGRRIEPLPYSEMLKTTRTFRSTVTFPASGSGWVTSKWSECAAAGTLCFIHPRYDDQDHIFRYADRRLFRDLKRFVRVYAPRQLAERLRKVEADRGLWRELVQQQRSLFEFNFRLWQGGARRVIEELDREEQRILGGAEPRGVPEAAGAA